MDAVDGNAIGGLLIDVFGTEMTAASSTCGTCGTSRQVAELVVYQRAPGTVVRCRTCCSVLMVFVKAHNATCVDLAGLASLGPSDTALREQTGFGDSPGCRTSMQEPTRKGRTMPHEKSMSMGAPQEESMSMGAPQEESMSMGAPQEESMSMGAPHEKSMSMGEHEESMSTDAPHEPM
jgi:hypothetical protein